MGFVLIYKATELVNFAQSDLLMLGAFVAYMAVVWWGLDYWLAFLISVVTIAVFGALLDALVLRRVIGQPQFAVVMLTIGLGAMFRTFASVTWGSEIYTLPTPFGGVTTIAGVFLRLRRYDRRSVDGCWLSDDQVSRVVGELMAMSFDERAANPCIGAERADLVLAGCAILDAIRRFFPCERLRVADRGLREGMLVEMMRADGVWGDG